VKEQEKEKEYIPVKGLDALIESCKTAIQTKDASLVPDELRYIFISEETTPEFYGYTITEFNGEQLLSIYRSDSIYQHNSKTSSLCHLYRLDKDGYPEALEMPSEGPVYEDGYSYGYGFVYADTYPDTLFFMRGCFDYNDESKDEIELYATLDDYSSSLPTEVYRDWNLSFNSGQIVIEDEYGDEVIAVISAVDLELERFAVPDEKALTPSLYYGDKFDVTGYWQDTENENTWYHFLDDRYYQVIYRVNEKEVYLTNKWEYEFLNGIFYIGGYSFKVTEKGYLHSDYSYAPITYIPVAEPVFDVEIKPYSSVFE